MAFGSFSDSSGGSRLQAEINMVPLIDVMLVLLVIFIITAPLLTHAVKLDLPKASSAPIEAKPDQISLSIDAAGAVFWNNERVEREQLKARFVDLATRSPQAELQLRADKTTQYQALAEVMADAASAGVTKIGFVSDPASKH